MNTPIDEVDVTLKKFAKRKKSLDKPSDIESLRLIAWGLMCGLTEMDAWLSNPGKIIDLFLYRREYDDEQHQLTRINEG